MLKSRLVMFGLNRRTLIVLALVTVLAFCLRLYRLEELPPGLHHDEAQNGLDAQYLLTTGARPIYIGSRFNGEPLLQYSIMLSEAVFGMTAFAVRLPSALFGALTIPVVFWLVRAIASCRPDPAGRMELNDAGSDLQALAACFILATIYWHLNASREGYKPVFLPLFGALAFLCLLKSFAAVDSGRRSTFATRSTLWTMFAGLTLGFGFYTYPSIRFLYPVVALFVIFVMWRDPSQRRSIFGRAAVIALIALLVFAPLGVYYLQHPDAFFTRQNQVGIWVTHPNGIAGALVDNTLKVAGMFFVSGDPNPRENLPGRPALDWILAIGFVIGLAVALRRWKQPGNFLMLTWLVAMLIPTIATEAAPNFLRSLGAVVPTAMLVVSGYAAALRWLADRPVWRGANGASRPLPAGVMIAAVALLLGISAALSLDAYFDQLPRDPRAWYAFDVGLVKIGELVRALPLDEPVYLTPISSEQASIEYTLAGARPNFKWFDGRKCLVAPPTDHTAMLLVVAEDYRTAERMPLHWPGSRVVQTIADYAHQPYLSEFLVPALPWNFTPASPRADVFGNQMRFLGYTLLADLVQAGQGVPLILFWSAQQPMRSDYTIFTHLLGANNPRIHAPLWGQNDHQPCAGGYPTTRWSPGEIVAEDFLIVVDKDAPAGRYSIELGAYELEGGARLTLSDGGDRVLIGPVQIVN